MNPGCHVWVRQEHSPVELPGLLTEWRRDEQGEWVARVVFVLEKQGRTVVEWVDVERVRPIEPLPNVGGEA